MHNPQSRVFLCQDLEMLNQSQIQKNMPDSCPEDKQQKARDLEVGQDILELIAWLT